jgi:hypothetical protein
LELELLPESSLQEINKLKTEESTATYAAKENFSNVFMAANVVKTA